MLQYVLVSVATSNNLIAYEILMLADLTHGWLTDRRRPHSKEQYTDFPQIKAYC